MTLNDGPSVPASSESVPKRIRVRENRHPRFSNRKTMKAPRNKDDRTFRWLVSVGAACLLAACASPKIDWNSRVGNFSYDQAVAEMGPPDKSTKLSDGSTVAEWFLKHNSSVSFGVGTGFYSGRSSMGVGQTIGTSPSGQYLRLTFAPDGKLAQWERVRH